VSYIPAVVLLVAGLVVLAVVLLRLRAAARRLSIVRSQVNAEVSDATGMLRARSAAFRVAVRERRRNKVSAAAIEASS
jgi:hypothetical protein